MTVLKKAIIRAYTAATHKASLQVAGSLAVWLDSVPVATNIPAADVVAGRACSLLLFDPYGPTDAVVISVQGANPSGTGALTAYQTVQDEGVSLTQRSVLDFRGGLVRAVDDAGPAVTAVHIGKQPDGTDLFLTSDTPPTSPSAKSAASPPSSTPSSSAPAPSLTPPLASTSQTRPSSPASPASPRPSFPP